MAMRWHSLSKVEVPAQLASGSRVTQSGEFAQGLHLQLALAGWSCSEGITYMVDRKGLLGGLSGRATGDPSKAAVWRAQTCAQLYL
jgi:hypothetical protein